ncbi:GNAT family N-acetyltransferase [Paracoccus onubensis]|uniref:GNAT family N-acetyltransferase n=1 Tax=Paracoccus onubensis TaxID=1675788 RepID=UPI00160123AE|nr:N-acetyltransferase [Paracoccus onubensis]
MSKEEVIRHWRLSSGRAGEWREIRLESLRVAAESFDTVLTDWQDRPLADFAARLDKVPTFAAGAEIGSPLAVASWQAQLDARDLQRGWLLSVYARPKARGRGFAEAAIRAVLNDSVSAGMTSAGLHVLAENSHAISLYRRLGFVETGREGLVNARGAPEIEMILPFGVPDDRL